MHFFDPVGDVIEGIRFSQIEHGQCTFTAAVELRNDGFESFLAGGILKQTISDALAKQGPAEELPKLEF